MSLNIVYKNLVALIRQKLSALKEKLYRTALLPAKIISTCFFIGYFPEWRNPWSALSGIAIVSIIVHMTVGFSYVVDGIAFVFLEFSIATLIIGMISMHYFQKRDIDVKSKITIHHVFGQTFTIAMSMPTIYYFAVVIMKLSYGICTNLGICAPWLMFLVHSILIVAIPFSIYCFFIHINLWPGSYCEYFITKDYGKMLESFSASIYSIITLYILGILFTNMQINYLITFLKLIQTRAIQLLS